jgi:hypothetical protein
MAQGGVREAASIEGGSPERDDDEFDENPNLKIAYRLPDQKPRMSKRWFNRRDT